MSVSVDELYAKYGAMVLRRCRLLLRDESRAVDAVQDVFVLVMQHRHRLATESGASLLFRLSTNVCLNLLRSARRKPENEEDELLLSLDEDEPDDDEPELDDDEPDDDDEPELEPEELDDDDEDDDDDDELHPCSSLFSLNLSSSR